MIRRGAVCLLLIWSSLFAQEVIKTMENRYLGDGPLNPFPPFTFYFTSLLLHITFSKGPFSRRPDAKRKRKITCANNSWRVSRGVSSYPIREELGFSCIATPHSTPPICHLPLFLLAQPQGLLNFYTIYFLSLFFPPTS